MPSGGLASPTGREPHQTREPWHPPCHGGKPPASIHVSRAPCAPAALYLVLGAVFHLWHPGWLIFLTIPLHYMRPKNRLEQLCNPIMVTLIYLILGFFFHLWHPGWLVFLAIPLGAAANK